MAQVDILFEFRSRRAAQCIRTNKCAIHVPTWVDTNAVIERYNIITMSALQSDFSDGYERMVQQIYFEPANWEGPMAQVEETDSDIDTLAELAEAMLQNKIH